MTARRLSPLLVMTAAVTFAAMSLFAERLPVKTYTSADGLGSGFVDFIYRDSRGFMWFCTRNGLSRFDGSQFINYQIGETGKSPGVETIFEAKNGDYWVSTTGGTYRFNPNENSAAGVTSSNLNAEYVTGARGAFLEDSNGTLWLASGTVLRLEIEDGKRVFKTVDFKIPQKPNTTFSTFRIAEGDDGSLWVFTTWGIARRLPDQRLIVYQYENAVYGGSGSVDLIADRSGRIWISLENEIFVIKPEPAESLEFDGEISVRPLKAVEDLNAEPGKILDLPKRGGEILKIMVGLKDSSYVRRMFQSSDGDLWISAADRLFQISGDQLFEHTEAKGLPETMARIAEDSAGNLWIGGNSVLARLDRHGMVTFDKTDGGESSRFSSVSTTPDGDVIFGHSASYFARITNSRIEIVKPVTTKNLAHIWTSRFAFVDSTGDYWMLSTGALYRFSGVRGLADLEGRAPSKIYTNADGLKSNGMFQIYEDKYGDIWVSSRGVNSLDHGLSRLRKGADRFEAFTEASGMPAKHSPSSFAEDRFGNLWMTFYEGGLARFDGDRFEFFAPGNGIPDALLSDLHIDKKGRLWISSTLSGLLRLDDTSSKNPQFLTLTTKDGLSSNNIRTITEDTFGQIYLGTAAGIDCLSPETGHVRHYSVDDGLAADFVHDSAVDRNGDLWFVTSAGVSRLTPRLDDARYIPSVFIGSLRIAGVDQPVSTLGASVIERGDLSHIENNLQFDFFGLDFRAGERLRYQYLLEGADTDWSIPSEQRSVTFANLSPGTYRFVVRAVNSEGVVSEAPAAVTFRILPPIYARWWFITLAVLGLAVLIVAFYRYRLARLREVNVALEEARSAEESLRRSREERLAELEQVRSRIATDLHDDIGASLTQIAILSEVAQAQSSNGSSEPLRQITNVSNELVGTMSDIVWSINPTKDHFSDLTQRMRRFASDVLSAKGIGLHFNAPHSDDAITVNSNLRREVFLIFKESVNNIIKHSGATRVRIDVAADGDDLKVTIVDDGHGFAPEVLSADAASDADGGNGIPNMRRRTEEMNGSFTIESGKDGTTVVFSIPLEPATRAGGVGHETIG